MLLIWEIANVTRNVTSFHLTSHLNFIGVKWKPATCGIFAIQTSVFEPYAHPLPIISILKITKVARGKFMSQNHGPLYRHAERLPK